MKRTRAALLCLIASACAHDTTRTAIVGQIVCPTLVLHGRRDRVCPWRNATWLAEHLGSRDVTVRIFEKSAHTIACDAERDDVAREVVRFMSRLDGEAARSVDAR